MNYKVTFFTLALLLSGGVVIGSESASSSDDETLEVFRTDSFTGGDGQCGNRQISTPTPPPIRNLESPMLTTAFGNNDDKSICPIWLYRQTVGAALAWWNSTPKAGKKDQ